MRSEPPRDSLRTVQDAVIASASLAGEALRERLCEAYDAWLAALPLAGSGAALVALGSLGRREPAPYSDLDLVLVHDGGTGRVAALAERVWYPIWDSGVRLDHSMRTLDEALEVARADLPALMGMLHARHVAGDPALAGLLRDRVRRLWRAEAPWRAQELHESAARRWELAGEGAFLLEPDLKNSHGGLRDGQALHALALAQLVDVTPAAAQAYRFLLDVRGEVHRHTGRAGDVLRAQDHAALADALRSRLADGDAPAAADAAQSPADLLLQRTNLSARAIAHALDAALRKIAANASARRTHRWSSARPVRLPLARDVVSHGGEVVLARDAQPHADPGLTLRAARAAAEHGLPLSPFLVRRLAESAPPLPRPWPASAREDFVALLGAGAAAIPVLEALDLAGLLAPLIPGWTAVRGRAQHNPVHRYTVDRHLIETAAAACAHTREVNRPDLLLVAALLHDIGKGAPGDHSVAGAALARTAARHMGLDPADARTVARLVRHHLLLIETATGRDLDDPKTIERVAGAVDGSDQVLRLLHALTVADARATGPAAWSSWREQLVRELVHRVGGCVHGAAPSPTPELDPEHRRLAEAGRFAVVQREDRVVVVAPDSIGVLYRSVGVLALHGLVVHAAVIRTHAGMAVQVFDVEPRFGRPPDPALVRADLARTLGAAGDLAERLRAKERSYATGATARRTPSLCWLDDAATDATVLEVRAENSIGLLCRVTAALERCRLDVRSARIRSIGSSVIDAFYLTTREGRPVPVEVRDDVEIEMRLA